MSRSLLRVKSALLAAGLPSEVLEMPDATRTAEQAAAAARCALDQIVKSIIFAGAASGEVYLFLTAGGNRVDPAKAGVAAGEPLRRADADMVRGRTGFAIGGVAPIGHLSPLPCFWDPRLDGFDVVWAAAGTPRHIFPAAPADLKRVTGARTAEFTA